ncbi:MAG TPA: hypothetical protein VKU40_19755 [Thermoanaerobaculia bacterium]|nr:hypothetical protein [Thermoanaerobaculia bacterium]
MTRRAPDHPTDAERGDARWEQFTDAWRERVEAPTEIPPHAAATRVLARLDERRRRPLLRRTSFWRVALAGAAALVVLLVLSLRLTAPPAVPDQAGEVLAEATPGENELLLWLDEETPLYLTLEPTAADDGETN